MGLAHQFDHPGVGGDGLREQLRLVLQAELSALQGQLLQLVLFGDLQLPEGLALVQGKAAEGGEEQCQGQAAEPDQPADCGVILPVNHQVFTQLGCGLATDSVAGCGRPNR